MVRMDKQKYLVLYIHKRPIHCDQFSLDVYNMVLILDGNSEMGAHVRSNLCYLISFRHLIRLREYVFIRKGFFLFIRAQYVLSSHLISVPWCPLKIGNNIFLNLRIFFFFLIVSHPDPYRNWIRLCFTGLKVVLSGFNTPLDPAIPMN